MKKMRKGIPWRLTVKLACVFLFGTAALFAFNGEENAATLPVSPVPDKAVRPEKQAVRLGTLPKEVKESSGLEESGTPGVYLTHNDAGNPPLLFKVNQQGKLLAILPVGGVENIDWEDLARDQAGNIYIADTGNNSNKRKKLKILKLRRGNHRDVEEIAFEYADRKNGTADKTHFEFDCEAIFWYRSHIYLVTKDREDGVDARLYQLPDTPGEHEAKLISHYHVNSAVTGADISPDGKRVLLLSEGKLHLFQTNGTNFFQSKMQTRNLGKVGQTEGAVFIDNDTVILTSENGGIFRYDL